MKDFLYFTTHSIALPAALHYSKVFYFHKLFFLFQESKGWEKTKTVKGKTLNMTDGAPLSTWGKRSDIEDLGLETGTESMEDSKIRNFYDYWLPYLYSTFFYRKSIDGLSLLLLFPETWQVLMGESYILVQK